MDVFNVNYDQDDIDMKKCHAYNPYEHDNMDKKIHYQGWMQIDVK